MVLPRCFVAAGFATALAVVMAASAGNAGPAVQWGPSNPLPNAVFAFGGRYTTGNMGESFNVFGVGYEDNGIAAVGFQHFIPWQRWGFSVGGEVGVGARFGEDFSGEVWGGVVLRHVGVTLFQTVTVSPAFTAGFSAVSKAMGIEREREISHDGDATFLGYLGAEVDVSSLRWPNYEVFWRLHHRSGAFGTFGNMDEGANANVVGLRHRF